MRMYILAILFSFVFIACSGSDVEVEAEALLPEPDVTQQTEPAEMADDIGPTEADLSVTESNITEEVSLNNEVSLAKENEVSTQVESEMSLNEETPDQ